MRQSTTSSRQISPGWTLRLVLEDVEAGRVGSPAFERRDQGGLVDHAAAADIDQDAVRSRAPRTAAWSQMSRVAAPPGRPPSGCRRRRRVRRALLKYGEATPFDRAPAVIGDVQAAGLAAPGDRLADPAIAEDAHRAAAQRSPREPIGTFGDPAAGAQPPLGGGELTDRHKEQAERRVGDFRGQHVGRVGDDDAALAAAATSIGRSRRRSARRSRVREAAPSGCAGRAAIGDAADALAEGGEEEPSYRRGWSSS